MSDHPQLHVDTSAPRILITRLSAIGDCILTLPMVCALRDRWPQAHIVWAIEPLSLRLLSGHRAVDQFLTIPKKWLKSYRHVRLLRQQLQAQQFDYVIDPQSLSKSCLLGWLSRAPQRIGFSAPQGREVATWLNNHLVEGRKGHLVDATLRLLEPMGVQPASVRFDVPIPTTAESMVSQFISDAHLSQGYAAINSAASWPAKVWPASRFGRLARYLGEQYNLPTVITWAGKKEAELAREVVAKSGGHALLAPDTSLPELAALLRGARMMVSSDTGPLHLAAAVGTPCLGLYGPTRAERVGPYGDHHYTVQSEVSRSKHRKWREDDTAMRAILSDAACQACDTLLSQSSASGPTTRSDAA